MHEHDTLVKTIFCDLCSEARDITLVAEMAGVELEEALDLYGVPDEIRTIARERNEG